MADSLFSNVQLLLHGNGSNGSTTFTDSSNAARTVTRTGSTVISTAQSKFGGASILSDGTSDYLTVPFNVALSPDYTNHFCVEFWVRIDTIGAIQTLYTSYSAANTTGFELQVNDSGLIYALARGSSNEQVIGNSATEITAGNWHHVAFTAYQDAWKIYVDGVGGDTYSTNGFYNLSTGPIRILGSTIGSKWFQGYMDDIRVTTGVERYAADFTPPTAEFEHGSTGGSLNATITLPKPTLTATGSGTAPSNSASFSLPRLTAYGAATITPPVTSTPESLMNLPSLQVTGAVRDASFDRYLNAPLPMLTVAANGGENLNASLPALVVTGSMRAAVVGSTNAVLPALSVSATATAAASASGSASLPMFVAAGYTGAVLSVQLGSAPKVVASGTGGGKFVGSATLPLFAVTASGSASGLDTADIMLPALTMAPVGKAWLTLPGFELSAIGSATVAVTYEAYALNLNHRPRSNETPVDELTHYTSFPFDKIVRYKNSYFGVNSTGLYLLEGTTDNGAPISWGVKTCMTDFRSVYLKTVTNAYFGGRLGEAATVTLHVGEAGAEAYSYTTPLGDDAQNYRQTFGKGVKNRYYALELQGSGAFTLDSMTLLVSELSRRI